MSFLINSCLFQNIRSIFAARTTKGPVVQLVRMPPCHGGGRGFESRPVRKKASQKCGALLFKGFWIFRGFMGFYVYIIRSEVDESYYKGFSENPQVRLLQHNNGESHYTAGKRPWKLVYVEKLPTKKEALIREKALKKYSHKQIEGLIGSSKNIVGSAVG